MRRTRSVDIENYDRRDQQPQPSINIHQSFSVLRLLVNMETLRATYSYREDEEEENDGSNNNSLNETLPITTTPTEDNPPKDIKEEEGEEEEDEEEEISDEVSDDLEDPQQSQQQSPKPTIVSDEEHEISPNKKQKSLSSLTSLAPETMLVTPATVKKPKKKNNNVWTKPTSRKGKKKIKSNNHNGIAPEDTVLIAPIPRFPDKSDDSPDMKICLSKIYKAEKVELSDDRLSAGSSKGYRMVRSTRGVVEGAWYFEIRVSKLGETGHTRLGWSMEKGDLQAPVGYDGNSFGYRDVDGSKIHKAMREKYGEGYVEGDVIGCYINLPEGALYTPKPPHFVWYKGQKYMCAADGKEESPKVVPGSEISFFKNGVCQGVAFKDLCGGRYYSAASMYTLPNQPNCVVKFNFGPNFEFFPQDFSNRPIPRPMIEVPYHGVDGRIENGGSNEKKN